jgi:hypothetical protein
MCTNRPLAASSTSHAFSGERTARDAKIGANRHLISVERRSRGSRLVRFFRPQYCGAVANQARTDFALIESNLEFIAAPARRSKPITLA